LVLVAVLQVGWGYAALIHEGRPPAVGERAVLTRAVVSDRVGSDLAAGGDLDGLPTIATWTGGGQWDWSRILDTQLLYDPASYAWTLYWADRNSRWHRFDDIGLGTVDDLITEINDDPPASSGLT
jgi:hypothetical protein